MYKFSRTTSCLATVFAWNKKAKRAVKLSKLTENLWYHAANRIFFKSRCLENCLRFCTYLLECAKCFLMTIWGFFCLIFFFVKKICLGSWILLVWLPWASSKVYREKHRRNIFQNIYFLFKIRLFRDSLPVLKLNFLWCSWDRDVGRHKMDLFILINK